MLREREKQRETAKPRRDCKTQRRSRLQNPEEKRDSQTAKPRREERQ